MIISILILLVMQIGAYRLLDRYGLPGGKFLVVMASFFVCLLVLPEMFLPPAPANEPRCGMPQFALMSFFMIFGFGSTLIGYVLYKFWRSRGVTAGQK
jgi:hypothetical protein